MPYILVKKAGRGWTRIRLGAEPVTVAGGAVLARHGKVWTLFTPAAAAILNGSPIATGIRTLRHGDEFMLGTSRCLFDGMDRPEIVPFPGAAEQQKCPRCRAKLSAGVPSARCVCGLWYHQDAANDLTCFADEAQARCVSCRRPTRLNTMDQSDPEA